MVYFKIEKGQALYHGAVTYQQILWTAREKIWFGWLFVSYKKQSVSRNYLTFMYQEIQQTKLHTVELTSISVTDKYLNMHLLWPGPNCPWDTQTTFWWPCMTDIVTAIWRKSLIWFQPFLNIIALGERVRRTQNNIKGVLSCYLVNARNGEFLKSTVKEIVISKDINWS